MTPHRRSSSLVLCAIAAVMLSPRPASAQMISVSATQLSSHAWIENECADIACFKISLQNSFALSVVPADARAELFERANAFVGSADLGAFLAACPACTVTSRPFMIPPGLLFQLVNEHGDGSVSGTQGNSAVSGSGDEGSNDRGIGNGGGSIVVPASGTTAGAGPSNAAALVAGGNVAALTPAEIAVTTSPEPATILLIASGFLGLLPAVRRKRRNRANTL